MIMTAAEEVLEPSRGGGLARWASAHPLGAFLAVTFAITWPYELLVFGLLDLEFVPWSIPGTFGPAIAAYVVTRSVDGRAGLHALWERMKLWRVGLRWYLFALVVLPAAVVAGYVFTSDPKQNVDDGAFVVAAAYVSSLLILTLMGGGQEEPGWRGFALPRMQKRWGPLKASLVLGVVWGVWHLPLFVFVPDYDNADPGFLNVTAMFLVFTACLTIGFSVILTWLANHTRASVLLAMLAHGSVNAASQFAPTTALPTALLFVSIGVVALVVVLATRGRLGYPPERAAVPTEPRGLRYA
jgi:membrane protease YdiL (CAAX protease family)